MPRRILGGGRVLGSGESINPPAPSHRPPAPKTILSPAPSTRSLSSQSQASTSPYSPDANDQDLTSRIFVENGASSISRTSAAAADTRLACPICDEEMVTLLQLNRHLDDEHRNLEDERQVEVKDWFQIQVEKARKFQPLAVLNQKLKGLDVFEPNSNHNVPAAAPARAAAGGGVVVVDPEELVTRAHWQPRSLHDVCEDPTCEKRLTVTNGCVNCRKCGRLFCEEHTMYQMRLSRSAQHDPVRGIWCRVCETCYKSREGYNDYTGAERDHTADFIAMRKPIVDRALFEVSRLEKRLTRLTQLLATLPPEQVQSGASKRWPISWQNDQRKILEQSVVGWQDDAEVARCPFCQQEFTTYTFRRHHCRTCGRVVCGDPKTECSMEVGLDVALDSSRVSEKPAAKISVDVRLCKDCRSTLFDRHDFEADLRREPPDLRAYRNLVQFERGIRLLLPQFQKLLSALQDPDDPPSPEHLNKAARVRKRLMDSFAQYDIAARRIRDLPSHSPTQLRLQKAIYHQATNFLHLHMLPLKSLPKVLKHATPHGSSTSSLPDSSSSSRYLAPIRYGNPNAPRSTPSLTSDQPQSPASSSSAAALSALESEEKQLREQLIVLQEQKFFVSEMVADAQRRRKFDEAGSLGQNLRDLEAEIGKVEHRLSELEREFEELYLGGGEESSNSGSTPRPEGGGGGAGGGGGGGGSKNDENLRP
ncbi:hypothetical protein VTO42DRAFT_7228 [Malbranchea cinnamomea]